MATLFLGLPAVTFLSLVLLPAGRPAFLGIGAAALFVGLVLPRIAPEDGTGFGTLALWVFGGAVGLAALAQGLRVLRLPGGQRPPYPTVVVLCVLGVAVPAAWRVGLI